MAADRGFGLSAIRERVLAAWQASPERFREDANTEQDHALGGYRDRLVVELLQNAADAASPDRGRVAIRVTDDALLVANTGQPLTAEGVLALSTLRASAKREAATIGRFGVGFAAVLAVTDEPLIVSSSGCVAWSGVATRDLAEALGTLADELHRRGGHAPVLRLPFDGVAPAEAEALLAKGFDTVVVLPWRDDDARALARRLIDVLDPTLMLTFPTLAEVDVDGRIMRCDWQGADAVLDGCRWWGASASGEVAAELLADRPAEEQDRRTWEVRVYCPVSDNELAWPPDVPRVLRAPQPTDEPLSLPLLVMAPVALDPSRRHVAPGPLTDRLVEAAAGAAAELVARLPGRIWTELVPVGVAVGTVDAAFRERLLSRLRELPMLPRAGEGPPLAAGGATILDLDPTPPDAAELLADVVDGLVSAPLAARSAVWTALGVRRMPVGPLVELLQGVVRPAAWWRRVYRSLADVPDRDALSGLPVPLADGRQVVGVRGSLLPVEGLDADGLGWLGLRLVDPEAADPALLRWGALEADPAAMLRDPAVQEALSVAEDDDPAVVDGVLTLVGLCGDDVSSLPWLGDLVLEAADGDLWPARDLALPGSVVASALEGIAAVADQVVHRWGRDVLRAVGVMDGLALERDVDVVLDPDLCDHDLDGEADWVDDVLEALGEAPAVVAEFVAVRDLDLVLAEAWPQVLASLAADPDRRAAVVAPVRVRLSTVTAEVASYTRWWLSSQPVLDGRMPGDLLLVSGDQVLAGLYEPADSDLDDDFLVALGCRRDLDALLADEDACLDLLDRLGDPGRVVDVEQVRRLYAAVAGALDDLDVDPPLTVRGLVSGRLVAVAAKEAVVVDRPDLAALVGSRAVVPAPLSVADDLAGLLGVALASGLATYTVESVGRPAELAGNDYVHHDDLLVRDADGEVRSVLWYADGPTTHATGPAGLARSLAWRSGEWHRRHALAATLRGGGADVLGVVEDALEEPSIVSTSA